MKDENEVVLEFVNMGDNTVTNVSTMEKRKLTVEEIAEIESKLI